MNDRPEHIPDHWGSASVEELTEFVTSGSRGWAKHYADDGPLFLRVGNLNHNTVGIDLSDVAHVLPPEGAEGERTRVQPGDILLSITAEVGMVGLAPKSLPEAYVNQHVALVRPRSAVWAPGLAYAFLDPQGLQALAKKSQYGATKPGLSLIQVRSFQLGVPPIREQQRIVEAIESYFTRLDDAVATLERVQRNLKRYRASVLKAAVEGRLVATEAELARAAGRDYEPASVLLERVLVERRRRWQEAGGRGKYTEPVALDTSDLPELPEGWCWTTVDALIWDAGYGTSQKCTYEADGPPVLRIPNVQNQAISLDDMKFATESGTLKPDGVVESGDLLFIRTNGSRSLIGRGSVIVHELPRAHHFASYLIRLRIVNVDAVPRWIGLAWHTPILRSQILAEAASSAGQYNVSLTAARAFAVPLPPLAEQRRVLSEVERTTSLVDACENVVAVNEDRCSRFRQSILKWAFEGRLADQDPSDEPGSALLERIRSQTLASRLSVGDTEGWWLRLGGARRSVRAENKP